MCPAHGVFVYWGVFVCVNALRGLSKAAPHSSLLKHFQRERTAHPLFPQTDRQRDRERREGFTLASGFWVQPQHNVLSLALFLTHTYSAGQWLDFNMVMIRDGGSGKGGEGAHIYCRGIGGEVRRKDRQRKTRSEWDTKGREGGECLFAFGPEI